MSDTESLLKQAGLKITMPRVKILNTLESAEPRHISAEELYRQLHDEGENLGLATVYRVLNQFHEVGLVSRHNFEGGSAIFERTHRRHDHIICQKCGHIIEFDDPIINQRLEDIAAKHHLKLATKELCLYGVCHCDQHEK